MGSNVRRNEVSHVLMTNAIIGYLIEYLCVPDAIVSIGCGMAREFRQFARHLPLVRRVGVDAIGRFKLHVKGEFVHALCSDHPVKFFRRIGLVQASTVYKCNPDHYYRQVKCRNVTLDEIWSRCDLAGQHVFLWLDSEGSEQDIMRSGQRAMNDCRHVLTEVCGTTPGRVSSQEMWRFMMSIGYKLVHTFCENMPVETHFYERKPKQ